GERGLAGAVLPDDGQRRSGGNGEIEVIEDGSAAWIRKREIAKADVTRRHAGGRTAARSQGAGGRHRRPESQDGADWRRGSVERPVQAPERDRRRADGTLSEDDDLREV